MPHRELGGKLTRWKDVLNISDRCKRKGIKFHCDGARIFEASAGYNKSFKEISDPFDSIYISFYKGLGSISGSMLMGSKDFCSEARTWLSRFGGNLYSLLPYAVSCWKGYNYHVLGNGAMSFKEKFAKLQILTQKIKATAGFSDIALFEPEVPETNMIHVYLKLPHDQCISIKDMITKKTGYTLFSRIREVPETDPAFEHGNLAKFEWTIGEANGAIDDEVFVEVWEEFCSFREGEL